MSATNVGDRITKLASPIPTRVSRKIVRKCRQERRSAPDERSCNDDGLPREAFRQRTHEGRSAHVEDKEDAGEHTEGGVAVVEFRLYQVLHRKQYGTVDVVEKVQRRQQSQRRAGIEFRGSHEIERI